MLILPRRFKQQPQRNARAADPSILKAFIPANGNAVPIGGITPIIGSDGVGFRATSSAAYYQASPTRIISGLNQWTIIAAFSTTQGVTSNGAALYSERWSSGLNILKLEGLGNSAPYLQMTVRDDLGTLLQFKGSTTVTNDGKFHVVMGVRYATNDHRLFVDGRLEASNSGSVPGAFTGAVESRIGSDAGDATSFVTGPIYLMSLLNRAISPAEIAAIGMNPWQLFKAPVIRLLAVSSDGTTHDLTVSNASQANAASTAEISQTHALTVSAATSTQGNTTSDGGIEHIHSLNASNVIQGNITSESSLAQGSSLVIEGGNQANGVSTNGIAQTHILANENFFQGNQSAENSLTQTHGLTFSNTTQSNIAGEVEVSLGIVHNLDVSAIAQPNAMALDSITQAHSFVSISDGQNNDFQSATVTQNQALIAVSATQNKTLPSSEITQIHICALVNIAQNNAISSSIIEVIGVLVVSPATLVNQLGSGLIAQLQILISSTRIQGNKVSVGGISLPSRMGSNTKYVAYAYIKNYTAIYKD